MATNISKVKAFMFENYWLLHDDFMAIMKHGWAVSVPQMDSQNASCKIQES
jgi:hypothetical protein